MGRSALLNGHRSEFSRFGTQTFGKSRRLYRGESPDFLYAQTPIRSILKMRPDPRPLRGVTQHLKSRLRMESAEFRPTPAQMYRRDVPQMRQIPSTERLFLAETRPFQTIDPSRLAFRVFGVVRNPGNEERIRRRKRRGGRVCVWGWRSWDFDISSAIARAVARSGLITYSKRFRSATHSSFSPGY